MLLYYWVLNRHVIVDFYWNIFGVILHNTKKFLYIEYCYENIHCMQILL